jgi:hypothetical protein
MKPGDRVTYQHGLLGKLDGQITAIKGEWPKQKIDVAYKVDGVPRSTVMTTDQAAVKLEHRV